MAKELIKKSFASIKPLHSQDYPKDVTRLMYGEINIKVKEKIKQAIIKELDYINLYPPVHQTELIQKLARYNKMEPGQIMIANGSDALIDLMAKIFIGEGDEVIIPVPSFPTYTNVAMSFGGKVVPVELEDNFDLDMDKLISRISQKTKMIFLANPNNPTGNLLADKDSVRKILEKYNGILIVDECYYEFADYTVKDLIKEYPNLLILRSLSKTFGIAGLRVGYCMGQEEVIEKLNSIQSIPQPFHVNRLSLAGAAAALDLQEEILADFMRSKERFTCLLSEIKGVEVLPTKASFVIIRIKGKTSRELHDILSKKGIFIKKTWVCEGFKDQYAYLGVPSEKDMPEVVEAVKEALS